MALFPPDPRIAGRPRPQAPGTAALLLGVISVGLAAAGVLARGGLPDAAVLAIVTSLLASVLCWAGRRAARRGLATNGRLALAGLVLGLTGGLVALCVLLLR